MKKSRSIAALLLAAAICSSSFAGCASKTDSTSSANAASSLTDDGKAVTLTVFSTQANYQGELKGWAGKLLKDKFNVTLNIIAPNVAGGGDTLYETRSSAGDLGDIVMISQDKITKTLKAGLFYDMNTRNLLKDYGKNLEQFSKAIKKDQDYYKTGSHAYIIPDGISTLSPTNVPKRGDTLYGLYTRWDYYEKLGYPQLNSMDDVVNMMVSMQKQNPKDENGKKTYAMALFKDWDYYLMNAGTSIGPLFGYQYQNLCEYNTDATQVRSILDENSYYLKTLKFLYDLNKKGLLDPDSASEDFSTVGTKYQNGQLLLGFWSYNGEAQFNTLDHMQKGQGFEMVPLAGMKIFTGGPSATGGSDAAGIGVKCKNVVRAMKVLDYLYSDDGWNAFQNGPKGLCYTTKDGKNTLTEFALNATADTKIPDAYGGGTWNGGHLNQINWFSRVGGDIDPNTNEQFSSDGWSSSKLLPKNNNKLTQSYAKKMNADDIGNYLYKNNLWNVQPGNSYVHMTEDGDLKTLENQIGSVVKQYSWKMVYAADDAQFNSLKEKMISQAEGLGMDKVMEFNKKDLAGLASALKEAVAQAKK